MRAPKAFLSGQIGIIEAGDSRQQALLKRMLCHGMAFDALGVLNAMLYDHIACDALSTPSASNAITFNSIEKRLFEYERVSTRVDIQLAVF